MLYVLLTGKWHKENFTNKDIVQILSCIQNQAGSTTRARKKFYEIITSRCPTYLNQYSLYQNGIQVQTRHVGRQVELTFTLYTHSSCTLFMLIPMHTLIHTDARRGRRLVKNSVCLRWCRFQRRS